MEFSHPALLDLLHSQIVNLLSYLLADWQASAVAAKISLGSLGNSTNILNGERNEGGFLQKHMKAGI